MIKFFRNIRKTLLMENPPAGRAGKTSKYLKYAIGEIVLVVIGILIALQINNWNEQRKNEIVKQVYLKSLIAELKDNIETYQKTQINFDNRITTFDHLFNTINEPDANKDSIKSAFDNAEKFIGTIRVNRTAFDELINSDNFQVFEKELRDKILDYYNRVGILINVTDLNLEELRTLRLEMYKSIDIAFELGYKSKQNKDILGWKTNLDSPQFLKTTNFFAYRKSMLLNTKERIKNMSERSDNLITELEKHLKN